MLRSKKYYKSKVSRVVSRAQKKIEKEHSDTAFVYFEEWYMTIEDYQLVINVPYAVTPNDKRKRSFTGIYTKTI